MTVWYYIRWAPIIATCTSVFYSFVRITIIEIIATETLQGTGKARFGWVWVTVFQAIDWCVEGPVLTAVSCWEQIIYHHLIDNISALFLVVQFLQVNYHIYPL